MCSHVLCWSAEDWVLGFHIPFEFDKYHPQLRGWLARDAIPQFQMGIYAGEFLYSCVANVCVPGVVTVEEQPEAEQAKASD